MSSDRSARRLTNRDRETVHVTWPRSCTLLWSLVDTHWRSDKLVQLFTARGLSLSLTHSLTHSVSRLTCHECGPKVVCWVNLPWHLMIMMTWWVLRTTWVMMTNNIYSYDINCSSKRRSIQRVNRTLRVVVVARFLYIYWIVNFSSSHALFTTYRWKYGNTWLDMLIRGCGLHIPMVAIGYVEPH